jgi:hypothetical protein
MNKSQFSFVLVALAFIAAVVIPLAADGQQSAGTKSESFDRDPRWDSFHNRDAAGKTRTVKQDFGFSQTNIAGKASGEVGGQVTRAARLAYYAAPLTPRTLDQKLSASGSFVLQKTGGSAGVFVGWFFHDQPDTARPTSSLGMHIDTEASGGRLAVRMLSTGNRGCGKFVTRYIPGKDRPTPLARGSRYGFTITYDPTGANGKGQVSFELRGHEPTPTIESPITFEVTPEVRQDGATFDRFGIVAMRKAGGPLSLFLDDLVIDEKPWDFSTDPAWDGSNNRLTYEDDETVGAQNFGYADSNRAGGTKGEIGGTVWRTDETSAWYADRVGWLSLDAPLKASGKIAFTGADPDSGVLVGWFSSTLKDDASRESGGKVRPPPLRDFVGVHIEGPTRVGHYFQPIIVNSKSEKAGPGQGPVLVPDSRPHTWSFAYDPSAAGGRGSIRATLDDKTVTFDLPAGRKAAGAKLDRFGILSLRVGGSRVKLWLDDLEYTAGP